jgi:hypothetical protein
MPNKPERLTELAQVYSTWQELDDDDMLEDRREYNMELLAESEPHLNPEQVSYLYDLIQLPFNPDYKGLYDIVPNNVSEPDASARMEAVCEVLGESLHQNLDGWSDGEKVVIQLYLMDLGIAANLTIKSYK